MSFPSKDGERMNERGFPFSALSRLPSPSVIDLRAGETISLTSKMWKNVVTVEETIAKQLMLKLLLHFFHCFHPLSYSPYHDGINNNNINVIASWMGKSDLASAKIIRFGITWNKRIELEKHHNTGKRRWCPIHMWLSQNGTCHPLFPLFLFHCQTSQQMRRAYMV